MSIEHIRRDYTQRTLARSNLQSNPILQFQEWFDTTLTNDSGTDPTAMVLATCAENKPTQRIVLLKGFSENGFIFYTNYNSVKGQQLQANPNCSIHFAWLPQERQIHIEGVAEKLTEAENTTYFQSRPRASQFGAWASSQSQPIISRIELDQQLADIESRFAGQDTLPLPPFWGGFRIIPNSIEFWQGRSGRLHDRFRYQRQANEQGSEWHLERLQP